MAFCFKKKESVSKAIRRLGLGRIRHAIERLPECDRPKGIHGTRKDIKKLRAVIGLARGKICGKTFRRLIHLLRKAAGRLADPRDSYVISRTLRNLGKHFDGQLAPEALQPVRADLQRACDADMRCFAREKAAKEIEWLLRRAGKELQAVKLNRKGWSALQPRLKKAYSAGQQAYQEVLTDLSPDNFHKWRKHAKALWYQVILLEPMWPEQMDAMAAELEALGEHLGDYHDLAVLRQALKGKPDSDQRGQELEILNGLIDERQRELRAVALPLGARFYSEKPSVFCHRLARYWLIWRGKSLAKRLS